LPAIKSNFALPIEKSRLTPIALSGSSAPFTCTLTANRFVPSSERNSFWPLGVVSLASCANSAPSSSGKSGVSPRSMSGIMARI
jgi:hypothetical protein